MGTQTRRASPITGAGRLPQLDLALGTRHRDRLGPITVLPTHPNQHQATPAIKEGAQCPWNPRPPGPPAGPLPYPGTEIPALTRAGAPASVSHQPR